VLNERIEVIRKALVVLDSLIVVAAFLCSFTLRQILPRIYRLDFFVGRPVTAEPPSSIQEYLVLLFLAVPFWCLVLYWNGAYQNLRTRRRFEIAWSVVRSALFVLVGFGALIFLLNFKFVSRLFFGLFISVSFIFLLIEKLTVFSILQYIRRKGHYFQRVLIVGKGKRAAGMIKRINDHPEWGMRILGMIDDEPGQGPRKMEGIPFLGYLEDLGRILKNETVDQVVFMVPRSRLNFIENAVRECETVGVPARVAMDLFNLNIAKARHQELDGVPFVSFETTVAKESQLFLKRVFDLVLSGIGIVVCLPLFLILGIFIKLTSRGPVFFKQMRAGLNGRQFVLYKFRTMYDGADQQREELEKLNEMDGPTFKIKKDPRITPIGRILRKISFDELPQLFNVFAGHMSLIGPRAMAVYEAEKIKPWQRRRFSMRPGITGLWQVSGRNKLDFDTWMRLDLQYLDNWSIWLDLRILVKTIPAVVFGIGAY
jgi:exopolysaccharide biosynthesis polyprenyl glycosylphosphotransferase